MGRPTLPQRRPSRLRPVSVLLGLLVAAGCIGPSASSPAPAGVRIIRDNIVQGGQASVSVRIADPALRTQANPAYTAADVANVDLYLYSYNAAPGYDYAGSGSLHHSVLTYSWTGGVDSSGNNQYTFNNVPIGTYVVVGRAKKSGGVNITKTVGGYDWAVTSNYVTIVAGSTTYSSGGSLQLNIPLQDAAGSPADVNTGFTPGSDPTATSADGNPPGYAASDAGDPFQIHDYTVTKGGVNSTFVWIPHFRAWQLINPGQCGTTSRSGILDQDRPAGWWVSSQPSAGTPSADWAMATFGGFYVGKYEASHKDATAALPGTSPDLAVRQGVVPWGSLHKGSAVQASRLYDPDCHLITGEEWGALAVWSMIQDVRIYGNNNGSNRDIDDTAVRFTTDPTTAGRALTGTGSRVGWSGTTNLTTHTGTTAGVYDLNGNVSEWITDLSVVPGVGGLQWLVDGVANAAFTMAAAWTGPITQLVTASSLRRLALPGALASPGKFHDDTADLIHPVAPTFRGGSWVMPVGERGAGILGIGNTAPMATFPFVGFRPVLAYYPHKIVFGTFRDGNQEIYMMNEDGSSQINLTNDAGTDNGPDVSPDRRKIGWYSLRDGNAELYTMNANGSGQTRITTSGDGERWLAWSPDGMKIAYAKDQGSDDEIFVSYADGSMPMQLTTNASIDYLPFWSPDGTKIGFWSNRDGVGSEIYVMDADGANQTRLTTNTSSDGAGRWSPDGTKIVFTSDRDGNTEIYVMDANGANQTRLTNHAAGDDEPCWSPDGSKIVFTSDRSGSYQVWTMTSSGTGLTQLTTAAGGHSKPKWW